MSTNNHNNNLIRYGKYKGKQIWLDQRTGIRHVDNGAEPGRKVGAVPVGAAVAWFWILLVVPVVLIILLVMVAIIAA